jgi:hypothetical protein
MKAKELKRGDVYRDGKGVIQVTIILDAQDDGTGPSGEAQVVAGVRHRDGGAGLRWFDAEDEVPYTREES